MNLKKRIKELNKDIKGGDYTSEYSKIELDAIHETLDAVGEMINKFIKTDIQGHPLPECKILWKLKKQIKELK